MVALAVAGGAAIVVYLGLFDPSLYPAPRCPFRVLTGYDCPGCGSQRALHALLHGRFGDAWHHNAALLPAVAVAALYALSPRRLERVLYSPVTIGILALAIVAWWVGRNVC